MYQYNYVTVASSDKLIKLRSKFDTQTSIIDTDFGSCSNGLETVNKKLIDHTSTPGKPIKHRQLNTIR